MSNIGDGDNCNLLYKNSNKSSKFAAIPIGLTQGQFNLNSFPVPDGLKPFQMQSICLLAFFYVYMKDPLKWTTQTINNIIKQGTEFVWNYVDFKESGIINCTIFAQNYKGRIQIQEPTIVDTMKSKTPILTNLRNFFQNNEYGLFRCSKLSYLMWKTNQAYFIFDGQGRTDRCFQKKNGLASLICSESINDVCKLMETLSSLGPDDCYSLSAVTMKYFRADVSGCTKLRIQFTNSDAYAVMNAYWAMLRGQIHIGSSGFKSSRNRQSMTIGLIALICKEIQSSNSWTSEFVDKIILLGTKLFHEYDSTTLGEINIKHLPREYSIHEYRCKIDYRPDEYSGKIADSNTDLQEKLKEAFEGSSKLRRQSSVLLQVNSLVFAIWRNNGYYYLFDAYARNERGGIPYDKFGKSCLHMHSTLESLWNVLCTNLTSIAENEVFVLHGISVILECKCEQKVLQNDSLLNEFMNDLCWPEMHYFQEMISNKDAEICNLDESSDDDFFNGTINDNRISSNLQRTSASTSNLCLESRQEKASVNIIFKKTESIIGTKEEPSMLDAKEFLLNSSEKPRNLRKHKETFMVAKNKSSGKQLNPDPQQKESQKSIETTNDQSLKAKEAKKSKEGKLDGQPKESKQGKLNGQPKQPKKSEKTIEKGDGHVNDLSESLKPKKTKETKQGKLDGQPKDSTNGKLDGQPKDSKKGKLNDQPKEFKEEKFDDQPKESKQGKLDGQPKDSKKRKIDDQPKEFKQEKLDGQPKSSKKVKLDGQPKDSKKGTLDGQPKESKEGKLDGQPKDFKKGKIDGQPKESKQGKLECQPKESKQGKLNGEPKDSKKGKIDGQPKESKQGQLDAQPKESKQGKLDGQSKESKKIKVDGQPKESQKSVDICDWNLGSLFAEQPRNLMKPKKTLGVLEDKSTSTKVEREEKLKSTKDQSLKAKETQAIKQGKPDGQIGKSQTQEKSGERLGDRLKKPQSTSEVKAQPDSDDRLKEGRKTTEVEKVKSKNAKAASPHLDPAIQVIDESMNQLKERISPDKYDSIGTDIKISINFPERKRITKQPNNYKTNREITDNESPLDTLICGLRHEVNKLVQITAKYDRIRKILF